MNDLERNYYNTFVSVRDFGLENAADFPVGSVGAESFAVVGAAAGAMEAAGAAQSSGVSRQTATAKSLALAALREDLRAISRTARSLAVDDAGIGDLFKMPAGGGTQNLLAAARSFLTNAAPLEAKFIAFEMPADFLSDLKTDIETFEQSVTDKGNATGEKVSATASIGEAVDKGLSGLRRLRAIIPNKYRDNPSKLAAWASAGHVARTAGKKPTVLPDTGKKV